MRPRHTFGSRASHLMSRYPKRLVHLIRRRVLPGASVGAVVALALIAGCTMFASSANASCRVSSSGKLGRLPKSPVFPMQPMRQQSSESTVAGEQASIVGLWDVRFFLPDGELYDEGFDQFHSDGTEILSDNASPQPANGSGTVCLGVFDSKGQGTYRLRHPFWVIDEQGNLSGTGVFLQTIVLENDATYHGSFTAITYDLNGHEIDRVEGNLEAQRITVD